MKKLALALLLGVSGFASAKPYLIPHVLERNGVVVGNIFNLTGGYRSLDPATGEIKTSPYDFVPSGSMNVLKQLLPQGPSPIEPDKEWAVYRQDFGPVQPNKHRMSNVRLRSITFPACDGSSKDAGYLTMSVDADSFIKGEPVTVSPSMFKEDPCEITGVDVYLDEQRYADGSTNQWPLLARADAGGVRALDPNPLLITVNGTTLSPRQRLGDAVSARVIYHNKSGVDFVLSARCVITGMQSADLFASTPQVTVQLSFYQWSIVAQPAGSRA